MFNAAFLSLWDVLASALAVGNAAAKAMNKTELTCDMFGWFIHVPVCVGVGQAKRSSAILYRG